MMIKAENLKKTFGEITAVDGIDLEIEKGKIVGLLGPNGAGKSTTISMISTLYKPTSGRLYFDGKDIIKEPKWIKPHLGYVPQEIALYQTLSGYENLKYFGGLYGLTGIELKKRIDAVSEIIGIKDRLKDKVEHYSGGMKRRINIGVALLHSPKLIIMDEPTVGIDPQSRNHILETVKYLNEEGMTVIYTSHYMEEVEAICQSVCIMDHGKVIAQGSQEALIEQSDIHTSIHMKFDQIIDNHLDQFKQLDHVMAVTAPSKEEILLLVSGNGNAQKDIIKDVMDLNQGLLSFDILKPNLEQVFLKLTGRGLRD
ncbi:ABC transporter ATP-binding protein [Fusibacter bizertensis]|uniref:ABC transporter ATP-binding protein n=1 Tax=Fusibacter bizertensis TaxID=1488331 RepID=A0ABT6NC13_9FIRM|nr:ABC transporter ATP-binding protein [Fusibacter bizertensis]MDH8677905.1 ABC transporter ATP-binding protein [Fusibacter bizertensis]